MADEDETTEDEDEQPFGGAYTAVERAGDIGRIEELEDEDEETEEDSK